MRRIQTTLHHDRSLFRIEPTSSNPSLAVPDQALTPLQIINRSRVGQSIQKGQGFYTGDDSNIDFANLMTATKQERIDFARNNLAHIKDLRAQINTIQADQIKNTIPVHKTDVE